MRRDHLDGLKGEAKEAQSLEKVLSIFRETNPVV
jgi:hypothetical protein